MRQALLFMFAVAATIFYSCSSDDTYDLNGTTWEYTEENNGTVTATWELSFDASTYSMYSMKNGSGVDEGVITTTTSSGNYVVEGKKVILFYYLTGTIDGNTIHFPKSPDTEALTLYKK